MKTYEELLVENDALVAQVAAIKIDDETFEGLTAWLCEFEQTVDVGGPVIDSSAGELLKILYRLKNLSALTPTQHLAEIKAEAYEAGFCKAKHVYKCELGYCSTDIHEWFDEWEAGKCAAKVHQGGAE
jgi:hypothetical protein